MSPYRCLWCRERFAGPVAYGNHFEPNNAECLSPDGMRAAGLRLDDTGFWAIDPCRPVVYESTIGAT